MVNLRQYTEHEILSMLPIIIEQYGDLFSFDRSEADNGIVTATRVSDKEVIMDFSIGILKSNINEGQWKLADEQPQQELIW